MKKYEITVHETFHETVSISANSEEDALAKFNKIYENGDYTVIPISSEISNKYAYHHAEVLGELKDGTKAVNLNDYE